MKNAHELAKICVGLGVSTGLLIVSPGCADAQQQATIKKQNDPKSVVQKKPVDQWKVRLAGKTWSFRGALDASANLSAIASCDGENFVVGSDDLGYAQFGSINRDSGILSIKGRVELLEKKEDDEIDIEGITAVPGGQKYFITGSHSLTKKGNMNKERRSVFEVDVDKQGAPKKKQDRSSLRDVIESDSNLRQYWEKAQQIGGVNIEGLAWKGEHLYFGFRSPNLDGNAVVVEVGARSLFRKGRPKHELHLVPLGKGLGIRELVSIQDGFLIVAGNAGDEPTREFPTPRDYVKNRSYNLFFWNPESSRAVELLRFPRSPGRPEAMLVLEETAEKCEILVMFDGVIGGAPLQFTIEKS